MSRSVPGRARTLAAEPELRFAQDAQLATWVNDAHEPDPRVAGGDGSCGQEPETGL